MNEPPFLDTNIFIYAFVDDKRTARAREFLSASYVTSVQALNEFAAVMRRKARKEWSEIRLGVSAIRRASSGIVALDFDLNQAALDLVDNYNFAFYDALMVAAALKAESKFFVSEDLQDGLIVDGRLTIINPFRDVNP